MDFSNFKKAVFLPAFFLTALSANAQAYFYPSATQTSYYVSDYSRDGYHLLTCRGCVKTLDQLLSELEAQGVQVIQTGDQLEIILGVDRTFRPRRNTRLYTSQIRTMRLVTQYLIMKGYRNAPITVYGHTDEVGSDRDKLRRSKQQAETIKAYLWGDGIPLAKLRAIGCADTEPVSSNQTVDGSAANRRIEIVTGPEPYVHGSILNKTM